VPYFVQIAALLREQIRDGTLTGRIPSESEMQAQHGVGRGTVRAAIAVLREDGLVVTVKGRGTFVRSR
jgi:GntR family transcriptional regulator